MGIWLVGKSLEDITKIPLLIEGKRLKVKPNSFNEIYDFKGIPIHYQIEKENQENKKYRWDISDNIGRARRTEHTFEDNKGTSQKFNYWTIELWNKIPEEFRDVIFFHELIELDSDEKGIHYPASHELATEAHENYISRYLDKIQQICFHNCMEQIRKRPGQYWIDIIDYGKN